MTAPGQDPQTPDPTLAAATAQVQALPVGSKRRALALERKRAVAADVHTPTGSAAPKPAKKRAAAAKKKAKKPAKKAKKAAPRKSAKKATKKGAKKVAKKPARKAAKKAKSARRRG